MGHSTKCATPEELESLKPFATENERRCLDALIANGSLRKAAAAIGKNEGSFNSAIRTVRARAVVQHGWRPEAWGRVGWKTLAAGAPAPSVAPQAPGHGQSPRSAAQPASKPARAPERPHVASRSFRDFPQPADFDRPMRVFIIPDVHVPNHHEQAWNTCLAALHAWRPDRVVILGDFVDDACVSSHAKRPDRSRLLSEEIDANNVELDRVQAAGCEYVDFLEGNHCDRLARYMAEKAPELYGLVSMPELLRINERGWRWHPYKTSIKIGKVVMTHDVGFAGKNAAWQNLAATGKSVITGHTHWATMVYQGHDDGTRHVSVTAGWLGDPEKAADYRPLDRARREWQHGFCTAEIDRDGVAWVNFRPIIDGRTIIDGRVIQGSCG